jgi:hypothetical protein
LQPCWTCLPISYSLCRGEQSHSRYVHCVGYHSPGLVCPSGYSTVEVATEVSPTSMSISGAFNKSMGITNDYLGFEPQMDLVLAALDPGETAAACCRVSASCSQLPFQRRARDNPALLVATQRWITSAFLLSPPRCIQWPAPASVMAHWRSRFCKWHMDLRRADSDWKAGPNHRNDANIYGDYLIPSIKSNFLCWGCCE